MPQLHSPTCLCRRCLDAEFPAEAEVTPRPAPERVNGFATWQKTVDLVFDEINAQYPHMPSDAIMREVWKDERVKQLEESAVRDAKQAVRVPAEPPARPEPYMYTDSYVTSLRAQLAQAETWKEAVTDALVINFILSNGNQDDPRKAIADLIKWEVTMALDPAISEPAAKLVERANKAEAALAQAQQRKDTRAFTWQELENGKWPFDCDHCVQSADGLLHGMVISSGAAKAVCHTCWLLDEMDKDAAKLSQTEAALRIAISADCETETCEDGTCEECQYELKQRLTQAAAQESAAKERGK